LSQNYKMEIESEEERMALIRPKKAGFGLSDIPDLLENVVGVLYIVLYIIFGSIYLDNCQIDPRIPVVLIVLGTMSLASNFMELLIKVLWGAKSNDDTITKYDFLELPFVLAVAGATIVLNFFVFGVYSNVDLEDETSENYCNENLYRFAFWSQLLPMIYYPLKIMYYCCCTRMGSK